MTYASSVLTKELQRAVQNRAPSGTPAQSSTTSSRPLQYAVSSQAQSHLEQLRDYRDKAKNVRVGTY